MSILTQSFVDEYKDKNVPFGPLGYITYKRTYARQVEGQNRTEEWYETCQRVINGNFELELKHLTSLGCLEDTVALATEAELAYDDMFHLRWLPPGRGLWMSGVDTARRNGAALTNCYYVNVEPVGGKVSYPFAFAMDMCMLGAGVGFGVSEQHISKLPKVANPVKLYVVCDPSHRDHQFLDAQTIPQETHQYVRVQDSREGWIYVLKKVIDASFLSKRGNTKSIVVDVSEVRASGERIYGFGGTASGPYPLVELCRSVNKLLNIRVGSHLTPVDCTDIMNMVGRCVVSGNVRRSAMIGIGDPTPQFMGMKNPSDDPEHNEAIKNHRWASNNSVLVTDALEIERLAESIWIKGEPGFLNLDLVQNYGRLIDGRIEGCDGNATGTNPCGEISLESFEPCNLAELFPTNCRSFEELKRVTITAYRYAKRVTLSPYTYPETQVIVNRNRRIGVSISGITDYLLQGCSLEQLERELDTLYQTLKLEDKRFSKRLQINESIKLTTVKPSGSISLLAGVSNGLHYTYAANYIRRIQFQQDDPLVAHLASCGFTITPSVSVPKTVVVHFPIKSPSSDSPDFRTVDEVSAREQLELQLLLQTHWADNQVSCTVSFKDEDRAELPSLIGEYAHKLKSTSFLPYSPSLKDHYPDLPFEPITDEQYEEMRSKILHWPKRFVDEQERVLVSQEECVSGACPIR